MKIEKSSIESILETLISFLKIIFVFVIIYFYIHAWINAWKDKKWLRFLLFSILPVMASYCLLEEMIRRNEPNVHRDMFEAQVAAWERENEKNR